MKLQSASSSKHAAIRWTQKRGLLGRFVSSRWSLFTFLCCVALALWCLDSTTLMEPDVTSNPFTRWPAAPQHDRVHQRPVHYGGGIDERRPDVSSSSASSSSASPADDEVEGTLRFRWRFDEVAPAANTPPRHNFTQQLPVGAKKFCTAHSEDVTMEVMEPYTPTNDPLEIPNRTVWVDGCVEPVMVLPFQGILMYPQLKCGALKPWKQFTVYGAPSGTMATSLPAEIGVSSEPPAPVVKSCLDRCLDSPCCLTFGIVRHSHRNDSDTVSKHVGSALFTCTLYLCDYTRAHHQRLPVEPYPRGYSYVLAHRREYRPSLVRGDWRLAFHRAPSRVIRIRSPEDTWEDIMRRSAPAPLPSMVVRGANDLAREAQDALLFDLRAVAEHGALMQPVNGNAEFRVRCYGTVVPDASIKAKGGLAVPNVSAPFRAFHADNVLAFDAVENSTTLDLKATVSIDHGRSVSDGSWLSVARVWEHCSGRRMQIDVEATIWRVHPDERLKTPFKGPFPEMASLRTTIVSVVHRLANGGARLGWAPPAPAPKSRFGEVTLPPNLFSVSPSDCAGHLLRNECCVRFLYAFQAASNPMDGRDEMDDQRPGLASTRGLEHSYILLNATTEIEGHAYAAGKCVTIVAGETSHFDEDGLARFPNLVVRVHREDAACVSPSAVVRFRGRQRFPNEHLQTQVASNETQDPWIGDKSGITFPVNWFLGHCGGPQAAAFVAPPAVPQEGEGLPILVSVPAHECLPCLHSFLANIRAFVWPSIVVIHFPSTISAMPGPEDLALLNRSHPRTYVNTLHVDSVVGVRLLHIHGLNIHYALTHLRYLPRFSHALLLASNELFVKPGVVEYMRRHDAVWMHNPTSDTGALYEHHGDGRHRWTPQEFHPMEEMLRYEPRQWGFVWPDAIVADHWLAAAMRRRNITKHPMNTVLLEGTFFRHDIATEFADEMMSMFDPFDYCEDPMVYPHCEVIGPTVLQDVCSRQGVRCGHRVTTMMWLHDEWTSSVDDIRNVRCSPFELPFGFKRIPRSMDNPVRAAIARLTTAAMVAAGGGGPLQVRDTNVTYCSGGV